VSSPSEIFTGRSEGQKARDWGGALPPACLVGVARQTARRAIKRSNLLNLPVKNLDRAE
jgi:hypothetical protein